MKKVMYEFDVFKLIPMNIPTNINPIKFDKGYKVKGYL
jgi:hypothetical protein